jgi:glutathione S-transferase
MSDPSIHLPSDDRAYHLRRLEQERKRAETATDRSVRYIHERMAAAYAQLLGDCPTAAAGRGVSG